MAARPQQAWPPSQAPHQHAPQPQQYPAGPGAYSLAPAQQLSYPTNQVQYQQPAAQLYANPNPQVVYMAPGYVQLAPTGKSAASMWIGIVSLFFGFTFFLPLLGFVLGVVGYKRELTARSMSMTGLILNGIFLVGWSIVLLIVIGGIVAAAAAVGTYSY